MPWKVLSLPAEAEANDVLGRKPGESLFEERLPLARREELKKADPVIWDALYQQKSVSYGGAFFAKEDLHFYKQIDRNLLNLYMLVDPANTKKKRSDYTAIFIFGVGEDRNFYWVRMVRDRLNPEERALKLIQLHRLFKPLGVGYEEYGMQSDIFYLEQKQERLNYRFSITPLGKDGPQRGLSKQDRIRLLVPLFKNGQVWIPEAQVETLADSTKQDMIPVFIEREFLKYPHVTHDDMLDVMSRITDPQMKIEYPIAQDQLPEVHPAATGRTWVSA
jgi:phage terminase large subunit-like protein